MKFSQAVIAIGNTTTAVASVDEHFHLFEKKTFFSIEGIERDIVAWCGVHLEPKSHVVVASVVPARGKMVISVLEHHGFHLVQCSSASENLPIKISYRTPLTLGADRIAASVGAFTIVKAAVIVVDCGTATSITVVNTKGELVGGAITLGIGETMKVLADRGAQLHEVELVAPPHAIGASTEESLQSGVVIGHAAMIDGMIHKMKKEIGETQVILTGGAADVITKHLTTSHTVDRDLVLKGLTALLLRP